MLVMFFCACWKFVFCGGENSVLQITKAWRVILGLCLGRLFSAFTRLFVFVAMVSALAISPVSAKTYGAPKVSAENIRDGNTWDGYELAETFLLKNVETGLYLKAISQRKLRMRKYIPNDITFEWIVAERRVVGGLEPGVYKETGYKSEGIFSAWDGLAISGNGDVGVQAYTADQSSDHWTLEENPDRDGEYMIVHPEYLHNANKREAYTYGGESNPGGLRVYDGRTIVRSKQSFADKKYVWIKEKPPGKGRDLAIIRIENVQAIKTSEGTDGATDALFIAIDIAVEYGPALASGGAGAAKFAAGQLAKRALAKAAKDLARSQGRKAVARHAARVAAKKAAQKSVYQSVKLEAKKALIKQAGDKAVAAANKGLTAVWKKELAKAAAKKIAKAAAKKAAESEKDSSTDNSATERELLILMYEDLGKEIDDPDVKAVYAELATEERAMRPKISASSRDGTEVEYPYTEKNPDIFNLRNKKGIYLEILTDPLNKLTTQDLTDLWQSLSNVDESIRKNSYRNRDYDPILNAEMRRKAPIAKAYLVEQYLKKYILSANVKQSAVVPTPLTAHPLYAKIDADAEFKLLKFTNRLAAAFAVYDSSTTSEQGIREANSCVFDKPAAPVYRNIVTRDTLAALPDKNTLLKARPKGYSAGLLTAFDPSSLTNNIKALVQDTPDQLEIKFNKMSAWPNGGGDWRTIKMHEVKNVAVELVFDRQVGVHVQLKEYDSGSDNDDLGWLEFSTSDLVGGEHYKRAYIRNKSEGSIYTIDFSITSLNGAHKTVETCARQAKISKDIHTAVGEFEKSVRELHKDVLSQKARLLRYVSVPQTIQKRFGDAGLEVYNTLLAASKNKVTCPADSADYGKLLAGDWRIGVYDNRHAEKLRQTITNYTFSADGTFLAGYEGSAAHRTWSKVPNVCELTTTYGKIVVSSEEDGLVLYTENDIPRDTGPMRLARSEYNATQYTDENGTLQLGTPEGIDYTGHGRWMEKIEDHPLSAEKITGFADKVTPNLIGIWDVPGGMDHRWTFTSDNLFVASVKTGDAFKAVTGRWKYLGDRRVIVTLNEAFNASDYGQLYNSLGKEFRVYLPVWSNLKFDDLSIFKTGEYWRQQEYLHVQGLNIKGEKRLNAPVNQTASVSIVGKIKSKAFKLDDIASDEPNDETVNKLIAFRKELNLPVPEEEVSELTKFLTTRAMHMRSAKNTQLVWDDADRQKAKWNELKAIWDKTREVAKQYDDERYQLVGSKQVRYDNRGLEGICGTLSPKNKQKFVGDWTVALFDSLGKSSVPAGENAKWRFKPDGTLSGSFDGKPWSATWTDEHDCFGKAVFDAETAKNYNLETEITIEVRFQKNGNRRLFVMEHDPFFAIEKMKIESPTADKHWSEMRQKNPWSTLENKYDLRHKNLYGKYRLEQKALENIAEQRFETETEFQARMLESGDRKLYTVQKGTETADGRLLVAEEALVADGAYEVFDKTLALTGTNPVDPEDALRFVVNYDELHITKAGVANRCSPRWVNNDIGPGKKPVGRAIGFDLRSVNGPSHLEVSAIELYKVNFEGPEAELLDSGSVFDGVLGDEFVIVEDNECHKLFKAAELSTTPVRGSFKFNEATTTTTDGSFDTYYKSATSLYFDAEYSDLQKAQGCEVFQWAQPDGLLNGINGNEKVERRIGNTNAYDIFVYGVDDDGNYPSQTPVLTVKPGEMKTLKAVIGERYPVFKKDFTCEAVATISSQKYREIKVWEQNGSPQNNIPHQRVYPTDDPQIILGDGSTPIDHPDYLNPAQVANGCLDFGNATSIPSDNKSIGHVANSGSSDILVHWIGYNGKYDVDRPNFTVKPGQTALLTDFKGAKYQLLDKAGQCVGIVGLTRFDETSTIGDGSTPITGDVIDKFEVAGIKPVDDLSKHQIANGCSAYGKIASTPSNWKVWQPKIMNSGTKPLTVQWMSFYGSLEDDQSSRNAKVQYTIPPGELVTFKKYSANDVLVVLDGEQCVAVMQGSDRYSPIAGLPSRVETTGSRKTYYVLRDQKSAEAFDERAKQWKLDVVTHKNKVAELEARWAKSSCENMSLEKALFGEWNVGSYDFGGREQQFAKSPTTWEHKESRFGKTWQGTGPDGMPFSADVSINKCTVEADLLGGVTMKMIVNDDLSSEFFTARQQRPEVLYSDGSLRSELHLDWRGAKILELERQEGKWNFEPQLEFWGRRSPVVGDVADIDDAANEVDEGASIGATVGVTALATDLDDDVTYSLSVSHKTLWSCCGIAELLAIDAKSGVVTVAGKLNYEATKNLDLYITATSADGSQNTMVTTIAIADLNDNAIGEITDEDHRGFSGSDIANGPDTYVDGLYEFVAQGVGVSITAQATDWDVEDTVTYSLSDSSDGMFAIDQNTGMITVAGKLNWDISKSHDIEVTATSTDGSSSRKTFVIPIIDFNVSRIGVISDSDKQPNAVDENAPIGTLVGVTAFAVDGDRSDEVVYWLDETGHGEYFDIDQNTGVVSLNGALNFDGDSILTITVVAQSSDRSQSRKQFSIAFNDIEQFAISEITNGLQGLIGVRQDALVGTKINLDADASDENATDEVTFSIANGLRVPFVIDPSSGEVTVGSKSLNETEITSYTLEIVANSSDGSVARKSFVVPVERINEFSVSALIDTDDASSAIDENAGQGTLIGITVFANDSDGWDNVTYSLNDISGPFEIDASTGVITVYRANLLDFETKPVEINSAIATSTDGSTNSFDFKVTVNDINEFEISYLSDTNFSDNSLDENSGAGTLVGLTAFANDDDGSDDVTYRLSNEADGRFVIDPITGVVSVSTNAVEFDFEGLLDAGSPGYYIDIVADSSDGSSTTSEYLILLNDVNEFDISAVIDTDDTPNEVDEFAEYGTLVGITAFSRDGDGDQDKNYVSYSFVDVDGLGQAFTIGQHTGVVKVSDMTNYDSSENSSFIRVLATGADGSTSEEDFNVTVRRLQRWYDDPQGPRVEADYPKVSEADRNICVAADDDVYSKATFNNENAYFDCMDSYVPVIQRWYDNPAGPRVETDFPMVTEIDRNVCIAADDDENAPKTFNNESVYFNCLERSIPTWHNNPEGPRNDSDYKYQRLTEGSWNLCDAANSDYTSQSYNNENAFFDCLDSNLRPVDRWYDNPQGPRVEADYPTVTEQDRNICIAADDDANAAYTFNDEKAYFDCLAKYVPVELAPEVEKWRDNPQGPRYEEDYSAVAQNAINYCRYHDEEPTSATYNNENAYFDCLTPYLPADVANDPVQQTDDTPIELWRDNPQGPRYEEDFAAVAQDAFDYCRYNDEEPTSATYNNENAYFDCLTPYLPADIVNDPVQQPVDPVLPPDPVLNDAPACAREYSLVPEFSEQTVNLTLVNKSDDWVEVHQVNADGTSEQLMYLEYGQSSEVTTPRRVVHVGFDPNGKCIGAGKMREFKGEITFGE